MRNEENHVDCSTEIIQAAIQETYINGNIKKTHIDFRIETHFYIYVFNRLSFVT